MDRGLNSWVDFAVIGIYFFFVIAVGLLVSINVFINHFQNHSIVLVTCLINSDHSIFIWRKCKSAHLNAHNIREEWI